MVFGKMAPEAPAQLKPVLPPTLAAQNEQTRANYDAIIKGLAAGKAGPPLKPSDPSSRLDKSAPGTSVTNQNNIKIVQQPGQSPQDLAKAVTAELDKRDRTAAARQRSSLGDYGE